MVNFWASWCVPCRREMPRLAAAARRLKGRVAFVGVDYKDQRGGALALIHKTGIGYPSAVDGDGAVGDRYGVYGLPTTVFIVARGRIVGRHLGEMSEGTLERLVGQLESSPPSKRSHDSPARVSSKAVGPNAPMLVTTAPLAVSTSEAAATL